MSVTTTYSCNGCENVKHLDGRGLMPKGWSSTRGFLIEEERGPGRGARPVRHFCPACTKRRNEARVILGFQRVPVR